MDPNLFHLDWDRVWGVVAAVAALDLEVVPIGEPTLKTEVAVLARCTASWLSFDVLKLGHHGSSTTSTGPAWLAALRPDLAAVSAGYDNSYGHPRRSVVELTDDYTSNDGTHLFRWGCWEDGSSAFGNVHGYDEAVYSNATSGAVEVTSDGSGFEVRTAR